MRTSATIKLIAAAALVLAAGTASAGETTTETSCRLQPGLTEWYNTDPSYPGADVIGTMDVTCDCIAQGPYGEISEFEVFTPYAC